MSDSSWEKVYVLDYRAFIALHFVPFYHM